MQTPMRNLTQSLTAGGGRVPWLVRVGVLALVILLWSPPFFVVDPTDMAGVRRLGTVLSDKPLGAGLHFKLPWVDTVDRLQVSLDVFKVDDLMVYTVDNQWVKVSVSLSYKIPPDAVLKLLYQVGRSGDFDIAGNLRPVIADRALRVFAKRNTLKISEEREQIAMDIQSSIGQKLAEMFGVSVVDLQIAKIEYSPTFVNSVEAAVKAKNDAVAAENTVNRVRYEAEQLRTKTAGEADAIRLKAQAEADAVLIRAKTEAEAIRIQGEAKAQIMVLQGQAITTNPKIIEQTWAEQWDGKSPQTLLGDGRNMVPLLNLPK